MKRNDEIGPGSWELDSAHFPRPASPIAARLFATSFPAGFAEDTARNGLMLDRLAYAERDGYMYNQPRVVGAPAGAPPPPKLLLQLLSRVHPAIRARTRTAAKRHETKPWRAAFTEWNTIVKPRQIAAHRALASEDLTAMSASQLGEHLARACECYAESVRQHGRFTISAQVVIGELIVRLTEWAGIGAEAALRAVQSFSPISSGDEPVASELLAALGADPTSRARVLSDDAPDEVLRALERGDSNTAKAAREYLTVVGQRTLNLYDVAEPRALEVPFVLIEGLRARLRGRLDRDEQRANAALTELLDRVPPAHHAELRYLVDEARAVAPLRDERVLYGDYWSAGLTRRALLEIGQRLVARGALEDREHAVMLDVDEAVTMLEGGPAPSGLSPAERFARRKRSSLESVPPFLGPPPAAPPPAEWLPEGIRTTYRATLACLAANFAERVRTETDDVVRGLGVSSGVYEGRACMVLGPEDFHQLRPGDVLITRSTSPTYNVVLPMVGALVTDRGGALSHAAIVSREFGIPGIVGCGSATRQIKPGARVKVDGSSGECRVIA